MWPQDRFPTSSAVVPGWRGSRWAVNVVAISASIYPALLAVRRHCRRAGAWLASANWLAVRRGWPVLVQAKARRLCSAAVGASAASGRRSADPRARPSSDPPTRCTRCQKIVYVLPTLTANLPRQRLQRPTSGVGTTTNGVRAHRLRAPDATEQLVTPRPPSRCEPWAEGRESVT
jgi:hypothetical protein